MKAYTVYCVCIGGCGLLRIFGCTIYVNGYVFGRVYFMMCLIGVCTCVYMTVLMYDLRKVFIPGSSALIESPFV